MQLNGKPGGKVLVLMPTYNDWRAAGTLLQRIDSCFASYEITGSVLVVDDGSSLSRDVSFGQDGYQGIERVEILHLRGNLGHQRAICIGLCHLESQRLDRPLVIMDADGEDAPEDVPRLLERYGAEEGRKVVFAARTKRSEGLVFRLGYWLYRWLHLLLTGHRVRVGNFSILPPATVSALVAVPELWSHYAAAVVHARLPWCAIPTERARRLDGSTRMNFVGLVVHGLAAISVFSDVVGVRLLLACVVMSLAALAGILAIVFVRVCTTLAIPGWATYSVGLLGVFLLQTLLLAAHFSFVILSGRNRAAFVPSRDYGHFVERCEVVFPRTVAKGPQA